jgi:ribosomal protein S18 acetylase RimI-like enzyme
LKIVRARASHLPAVAALMASSPLLRRYGVTDRGARRSLAEAMRERDILLVALDGPAVVGFAWLITTRALDVSAYLRLLLVAGASQSQGVGAALLDRAEHDVRRRRSRHLVLLVTTSNRRGRAFYGRLGYRHVGDLPSFVRPGIGESLYVKAFRRKS